MTPELEALIAAARLLPPMTEEERDAQRYSFSAGNVAMSHQDACTCGACRYAGGLMALDEFKMWIRSVK